MAASFVRTPGGRPHDDLNAYIRRINRSGISLQTRSRDWSPKHLENITKEERCNEFIKFLFFRARNSLDQATEEFEQDASTIEDSEQRLDQFLQLLEKTVHDVRSLSGVQSKSSTKAQSESTRPIGAKNREPPSSTFRERLESEYYYYFTKPVVLMCTSGAESL